MKIKSSFLIFILIFVIVGVSNYLKMPQRVKIEDRLMDNFAVENAYQHIEKIGSKPHYIGTEHHKIVRDYLVAELQKLNLEVQVQDTMTLSKWNTLSKVHNVIARKKGTQPSKALLLLTHYDSAPHSNSYGASDDANGLAVILESLRVFLAEASPKNDLIVLFSDAEELGLNGAWGFVEHHPLAKDVGVVINLEARGTFGPSMMLAETNHGNNKLIKHIKDAKTTHPVSNSILYSIYKLLPNDTDMTAFREGANIPGYTFAYIDGHYHYHTEQDNIQNFDLNSMAHQVSYVLPIIKYYSDINLSRLNGTYDVVFFDAFNKLWSYPFSYNHWFWGVCLFVFLLHIALGFKIRTLQLKPILMGFVLVLILLIAGSALFYFAWQLVLMAYPDYSDMLHGFTYNGHDYMLMFYFLGCSLCFLVYKKYTNPKLLASYMVAPLTIWYVIQLAFNLYLPGAGFLIIPILCGLFSFILLIFDIRKWGIHLLFLTPALMIMYPLMNSFPIGLGLKMLCLANLMLFLTFLLMYGIFGQLKQKGTLAFIFLGLGLFFMFKAHSNADFIENKAKPNSLIYLVDGNENKAYWATYNKVIDPWLQNYISSEDTATQKLNYFAASSKYNSGYTFAKETSFKSFDLPELVIKRDTVVNEFRHLDFSIISKRFTQRIDVLVPNELAVYDLLANGCKTANSQESLVKKRGNTLVSYYLTDSTHLHLNFKINKAQALEFEVQSSSFDLLENPNFSLPKRPSNMMPMPFVLTDAIVTKKRFKF